MTSDLYDFSFQPIRLVDEVSTTEYYIGVSNNGRNEGAEYWQIRKIIKIGNIWNFLYPNGDQTFIFVWSDRYGYTYA